MEADLGLEGSLYFESPRLDGENGKLFRGDFFIFYAQKNNRF